MYASSETVSEFIKAIVFTTMNDPVVTLLSNFFSGRWPQRRPNQSSIRYRRPNYRRNANELVLIPDWTSGPVEFQRHR